MGRLLGISFLIHLSLVPTVNKYLYMYSIYLTFHENLRDNLSVLALNDIAVFLLPTYCLLLSRDKIIVGNNWHN